MANFPIQNFQQSNPVLGGYSAVQEILKNNLMNQFQQLLNKQQQTQNQYQPQKLEQELLSMQNKNEMAPLLLEQQRIKNQYQPQTLEESLRSLQQRNARGDVDLQNYPEKSSIELQKLKESVGNPLLGQAGTAGQIGSMLYLSQHPELLKSLQGTQTLPGANPNISQGSNLSLSEDEIKKLANSNNPVVNNVTGGNGGFNPIEALQNAIESEGKRKNAFANLNTKKANAFSFNSLPVDDKKQLIAQARGMGLNADEASRRLSGGESLDQIAESEGFDKNNLPNSIYAATGSDVSKVHFREAALNEMNYLEEKTTDALAPYSQRIFEFSPKQIMDEISGKNPDQQARALAAIAITPEMAALKIKAQGGNVGIEAVREMIDASMNRTRNFQSLVKPEIYKSAQKYAKEWLSDSSKLANEKQLNQRAERGSQKNEEDDPLGIR